MMAGPSQQISTGVVLPFEGWLKASTLLRNRGREWESYKLGRLGLSYQPPILLPLNDISIKSIGYKILLKNIWYYHDKVCKIKIGGTGHVYDREKEL